jgi:hypothetical protein
MPFCGVTYVLRFFRKKDHASFVSPSTIAKATGNIWWFPTDEELHIYFRLYLLHFIGSFLMPESSSSRVSVRYLPLLRDPETVKQYSWGSACLAALYKGLCVVADTSIKSKKITALSGCAFLLQAWARFRIKCCSRGRKEEIEDDGPYALR